MTRVLSNPSLPTADPSRIRSPTPLFGEQIPLLSQCSWFRFSPLPTWACALRWSSSPQTKMGRREPCKEWRKVSSSRDGLGSKGGGKPVPKISEGFLVQRGTQSRQNSQPALPPCWPHTPTPTNFYGTLKQPKSQTVPKDLKKQHPFLTYRFPIARPFLLLFGLYWVCLFLPPYPRCWGLISCWSCISLCAIVIFIDHRSWGDGNTNQL